MNNDILSIVELPLNSAPSYRLDLAKREVASLRPINYDLNEMSRVEP